ncbi:MAG TPA: hypothetical protein VE010_02880, partial [Thermoanaerobaculia bacterium]|nr:hypothetical protein [Thermoanaerobaculia bacterium]
MPAIFLYLATTAGLLFVWQRYVQPVTRAAAIALVLLPLCFTGGALLTGRVYAPIDMPFMSEPLQDYKRDHGIEGAHNGTLSDLYMQMIPWQGTVRATLLRGEWPLWNPHLLCGSILAANMQSAVYDPLTWLGLLVPQAQALTYGAAMSFFFAAFFTFFFARALGLGELAALVAAAAYTFSGMLAFFIGWPLGRAWALFPFVMLGVRFVVRETSVRAAVLLTTAFVLALVAGHPESVLHLCTLGAIYGVYEVAVTRRWKAIPLAILSGAVALLLTAIALLPFFAVMNETTEHELRKGYFAQIELPSSRLAVERRAGVSLLPWYGGQPERANLAPMWEPTSIRTGSIALALALAALLLAPRRDTWFFLMLAVFCTWVGLNAWPVAHFLHTLPLFDITLNERLANAAAFSIAILAAIAVDAWPATRERTLRAAGVIAAVGVALGIATFMLRDAQIAQGVKPGLITMLTL